MMNDPARAPEPTALSHASSSQQEVIVDYYPETALVDEAKSKQPPTVEANDPINQPATVPVSNPPHQAPVEVQNPPPAP